MTWVFGEFELDTATLELRRAGEPVSMEPQVFRVLVHLVEHRDRVVTKEELLDEIWGSRFVSESALTSRVKSARQAVGDSGRDQRIIKTFHGRGYRFVLPLDESTDSAAERRPSAAPTSVPPPELTLAVDQEFPFVGRVEAVDFALSSATTVTATGPSTLLIGGEPGVGKSRLALEIADRVADTHGFAVIGGRCEQHLASSLQPWLEALAGHVATADPEQLRSDTHGLVDRLRAVLPLLDRRLGSTPGTDRSAHDDYATVDGIVTLVERIAQRRPMVIVLDDVQWAGGATRALASLLLRRGVAPILIVLTFRTTAEDLGVATAEWIDGLERNGAARIDLEGLSEHDVADLVVRTLGVDGDDLEGSRSGIWQRSEGHSLFAVELIREVRDGGGVEALPASVASLVQRRLDKLPPSVASLVVTGAAFGQEFDLGVAAAVADLTDHDALDAVDGALGAQLLHEIPGRVDGYRFSHQLVPAAAIDSISWSRRVRLHAAIAAELDLRGAPGAQVAHHLIEAAPVLDAHEVAGRVREVSAIAVSEHQYDRAAELLERAARLDVDARHRAELLAEFGAACNLAGQQPRALDALHHAAAMARSNGWNDLLAASALGRWGQSPFRASRDRTVIPLLDEAIGRSDDLDEATRARLLAKRAAFNLFTGELQERDRLSARAVELVGDASTPARLEVLEARWMAIASPARISEVVELDAELEVLRKELGALSTDACAPEISIYWRALGEELRELAAELNDDPRQRRDVDQWRTTALAGCFALFDGDVEASRELADRALPLGEEPWGEAGHIVHALVHLVTDVIADRASGGGGVDVGDRSRSAERWRRAVDLVPSDAMRTTRAWAEAAWGDPDVASDLVDHVMPRVSLLAENFMGGFGLVALAETALLLGRTEPIDALVAELEPLAGQMLGHPWAPSFAAADVLARLQRMAGRPAAADDAADRARALYGQLGATSFRERFDAEFA